MQKKSVLWATSRVFRGDDSRRWILPARQYINPMPGVSKGDGACRRGPKALARW
ncbi:hypothetical Protein YC6258_01706 [Gynuella sunshinyii YC6258]|uniref:Uncharacterized protein n=1 Tax=Gynuella sunshinyii YC6258 TaxID=1445510 RepID=A0A0C5VTV7_9GAMM|nr:hypothetical Protein YC6258_01706 [Gynuella sunshinyii YC6258]